MLTPVEPQADSIAQTPIAFGASPVQAPHEQLSEPILSTVAGTNPSLSPSPGASTPGTTTTTGPIPDNSESQPVDPARSTVVDRRTTGAIVLIVVGLLLLIANLSPSTIIGLLILPALGAIFLTWGILARLVGPLIPGGILTGLGLGIALQQLFFAADTPAAGGIVVLGLGLGFLAITPLALAVTGAHCWWPLIPGSILSIVGVALLMGSVGLAFLTILGRFWPLILIAAGLCLLWRATKQRGALP
jgi:hypothetical protein